MRRHPFQPDHNGECLVCDDWADGRWHTDRWAPPRQCRRCGRWFTVTSIGAGGSFCTRACYRRQTPSSVFASCVRVLRQSDAGAK